MSVNSLGVARVHDVCHSNEQLKTEEEVVEELAECCDRNGDSIIREAEVVICFSQILGTTREYFWLADSFFDSFLSDIYKFGNVLMSPFLSLSFFAFVLLLSPRYVSSSLFPRHFLNSVQGFFSLGLSPVFKRDCELTGERKFNLCNRMH